MPWSKAPDAFKRSEASWRRMLVTQPSPLRLIVTSRSDGRGGASQRRGIMNDASLRMGTLYDFVLPCVNQYASSFCVRWCEDTPSEDGEREISLIVASTMQCSPNLGREPEIDRRFYSNGAQKVEIEFGPTVFVPRVYGSRT
ncbi:hypothetical protein K438DRAFT_2100116 [Mycena galopus ATCC 62051]|nr:hypothetical protein K438DRAFT_2100116 [Mycena galopus ATCC 62051]